MQQIVAIACRTPTCTVRENKGKDQEECPENKGPYAAFNIFVTVQHTAKIWKNAGKNAKCAGHLTMDEGDSIVYWWLSFNCHWTQSVVIGCFAPSLKIIVMKPI